MKQIAILTLALCVLQATPSLTKSRTPEKAQTAESAKITFEHKAVTNFREIQGLGQAGWELVSVTTDKDGNPLLYYLKRASTNQ